MSITIQTPEGEKEAEAVEFSLQEYEKPVKIICEDGVTLLFRATIAAVFMFKQGNGKPAYHVIQTFTVVKVT